MGGALQALVRAVRMSAGLPGLWTAALAVVVQRLLHGAFHDAPFAPYALAEWVVRKTPGPLATYAIDHLGHRALPTFGYAFIAATLVLGFLVGRRPAWLLAAIAFALTLVAAYLDPLPHSVPWAFASAFVVACTAFVAPLALQRHVEPGAQGTDWARRRLLAQGALGLIVIGVGGTAALRAGSRSTPTGPVRADQPAAIPADPTFREVAGLSPRVTPRADHYVVDIDLEDPLISESDWRLTINGAVNRPQSLSLADLQAMATKERLNNLSCISNPVGGDLVSNSRWTGLPLDALLDMAQPSPQAVTLVAVAFDGYTEGIRLDEIRGKDALIAFGMNGELLPRSHGFPARLLFPNHYGMRNVKWLTRLELKTQDEEGYWARRGWDREAVVRTESRFDTPRDGATVQSPFVCGGIAWAGARRIQAVEVSPDGGQSWRAAELEVDLGPLSWRRWQVSLDLPPGRHSLAVRAVDGTGTRQDAVERPPHPSGASGHHRINVTVPGT